MVRGQFILVGVLITPRQRSALLRDAKTNKTETVALGGVVRGMTLGEAESSRVFLHQGAETEELTLNVQTGPKPPSAAQAQAVATPPPAPPAVQASAPVAPLPPAKPVDAASGPKPSPTLQPSLPKR
jgi:hypothetical protein